MTLNKKIFLYLLLIILSNYLPSFKIRPIVSAEKNVDQRTKELCRWYSNLDHEKEFAKERFKKNKKLIQEYDWYTSCINHIKYPVAGD